MLAEIETILRVCGIGRYLQINSDNSKLVCELLKRAIDAYGMTSSEQTLKNCSEYAPGRFIKGSLLEYPFKPETFDTIVIGHELFQFKPEEFLIIFKMLLLMTKKNLVLYFPNNEAASSQTVHHTNRLFWEKLAIEAGFRRHRREMLATSYENLENEQMGKLTFFERVPSEALKQFPMSWLLENRDLHMDMLREPGRRSDGHVSRYVLAAAHIRPGDVVLDAACGLGYGTAVLSACSTGAHFIGVDIDEKSVAYAQANYASQDDRITYHACDVTRLSFLPDHSVDTVISFETIEHVIDYDEFLAEVHRVLKPDGRFFGSVPNLWCDETGKDPNPFHFHVFDWNKLQQAVAKYFIVDGRWAQTAGGGFRLHQHKRELRKIPLKIQPNDTEWWIISACANPSAKNSISYINPFYKDANKNIPVVVNFEKYYDNPWVYRVMVQMGERLGDRNILCDFAAKIAAEARVGSADQGAALCVVSHQLLESENITAQNVMALVNAINIFDKSYDRHNLHAYRWAISLHFVGARLLLVIGNRDAALSTFMACAEMDPVTFSPLLATKTISARMYAGLLLVSLDRVNEAEQQFKLAIKEAHRVVQGDWTNIIGDFENPLLFGLSEAAEVLDVASQCAQALHALKQQSSSPGYFWNRINLKRFGLVEWNKNLERENEFLRYLLAQKNKSEVMV